MAGDIPTIRGIESLAETLIPKPVPPVERMRDFESKLRLLDPLMPGKARCEALMPSHAPNRIAERDSHRS
jgi:hypothetical protein